MIVVKQQCSGDAWNIPERGQYFEGVLAMTNLNKSPSNVKCDVYSIVTDKILELLDKGTVPWQKPWRGGSAGMPKNLINK